MRAVVLVLVLVFGSLWACDAMGDDSSEAVRVNRQPVLEESGFVDYGDDGTRWYDDIAREAQQEQAESDAWDRCLDDFGSRRACHIAMYGDDGGWTD